MSILFLPNGPLTECANINITRDFVVENTESFVFLIEEAQSDPAVVVGNPNSAEVFIVDEEQGKTIKEVRAS